MADVRNDDAGEIHVVDGENDSPPPGDTSPGQDGVADDASCKSKQLPKSQAIVVKGRKLLNRSNS